MRDYMLYKPPKSKRATCTLIITAIIILVILIWGNSIEELSDLKETILIFFILLDAIIAILLHIIFTIKDNPVYFSKKNKQSFFIKSSILRFVVIFILYNLIVWH